jgi:hypothetical protein
VPPLLAPRTADRVRALAQPVQAAGVATAAGLALVFRDPHRAGSWGWCPLHRVTGLACPFCGGLRTVWDLEHGRLAAAAASNVLVVGLLPVCAVLGLRWLRACWVAGAPVPAPVPAGRRGMALAVLAVAYAVVRNLPGVPLGP